MVRLKLTFRLFNISPAQIITNCSCEQPTGYSWAAFLFYGCFTFMFPPLQQSSAVDLKTKEEKDAELDRRIEALRKKNEALVKRYQVFCLFYTGFKHNRPTSVVFTKSL